MAYDDDSDPTKRKPLEDNLGMGPVKIAAPAGTPSLTPRIGRPLSDTGVPMYNQGENVPATGTAASPNPHVQELNRLGTTGSGVEQVQQKHPFWGGVLRGLDTAASIIAPPIAAAIPGTTLHHQDLIRQQEGLASQDVAREQREAQTQTTQAELPNIQAETDLRKAQAEKALHPVADKPENLQQEYSDAVMDAMHRGVNPHEDPRVQQVADAITSIQPERQPAVQEEQQFVKEYQQTHPGATIAQAQRAFKLNSHIPADPQPITIVVPQPGGGGRVERVGVGQSVPEGSMSPNQFGAQNGLTSATRTMVEAAPKVLTLADRVESLIDQQVNSLGPAASRWNEFMAGKVGAPNPEFTKLRTDVGLLTTLLMRMHVGARGGEYIMKHFQDLLDSGKQSPENLKAAIEEVKQYAHDVQAEGHSGGEAPPTAAPEQKPKGTWNAKTGRYE